MPPNVKFVVTAGASVLVVLSLFISVSIDAKITGAFVIPHGGIALDPRYFPEKNQTKQRQAWKIYQSRLQVSNLINTQLQPDLILLSTPHSLADDTNFLVAMFPGGTGKMAPDYTTCPPVCYNKSIAFDSDISRELVDFLRGQGQHNVSALQGWSNSFSFPLQWGELIPMNDINTTALVEESSANNTRKVILWMHPARRFKTAAQMVPELLQVGADIAEFFEQIPEKVVIVISSDLAHTHSADGPYGYSDAAQPFDDAIGQWVSDIGANENSLLITARGLSDKALSCGFTGLVMLHGMLKQVSVIAHRPKALKLLQPMDNEALPWSLGSNQTTRWNSSLLCNFHPTYFGMAVGQFLRVDV